jgi:hypothetical protein
LTESVYIRYAIGAEKDALEVGDKMTVFHREERARATAAIQPTGKCWGKLWGGEAPLTAAKLKQ